MGYGIDTGVDIIARGLAAKAAGSLDSKADLVNGKVPAEELPSYVDDVVEYADEAHFPAEGEEGKIYVALDTGFTYRWSGSEYVQIGGQDLSELAKQTELAPLYDNTATYSVGAKCVYNGKLYTCTTAITQAEDFNSSHWTEISVSSGFVDLDSNQTITGAKTINNDLTFTTDKKVKFSSSQYITGNNSALTLKSDAAQVFLGETAGGLCPNKIGSYEPSLGGVNYKWKDLYLSGKIKDGTKEVAVNELNYGLPKITKATWDNATTEERRALTRTGFWGEVEEGSYFISDARRLICFPSDASNHCPCYFEGATNERECGFGFLTVEGAGGITLRKVIYWNGPAAKCTADFDRFKSKNLPNFPTTNASPQVLTIGANGGNLYYKSITELVNNETADNTLTELSFDTISTISKSADTTFTLKTAPTGCLPEYKANITNSGASDIDLTFTGVSVIKTNDSNITIASNVLTLPAGTTIEVNIQNGNMIAFNWSAN